MPTTSPLHPGFELQIKKINGLPLPDGLLAAAQRFAADIIAGPAPLGVRQAILWQVVAFLDGMSVDIAKFFDLIHHIEVQAFRNKVATDLAGIIFVDNLLEEDERIGIVDQVDKYLEAAKLELYGLYYAYLEAKRDHYYAIDSLDGFELVFERLETINHEPTVEAALARCIDLARRISIFDAKTKRTEEDKARKANKKVVKRTKLAGQQARAARIIRSLAIA